MMFLMNDVILKLDGASAPPPIAAERLRALTLADVLKLGAELYAEEPLLHRTAPERARRLALLMMAKAPEINAALFVAPAPACAPTEVMHRVAEVSLDVMAALEGCAQRGELDPVSADRQVWRRLAA